MIAGIVTKVLLNPKVQTHWKAICGLKLTPHFTLFDPANMIPTLGNRGLPNSVMLCCQPRATSLFLFLTEEA